MNYNWYIVHTLSGSENKIKKAILDKAKKDGMDEYFEDIVIPAVEVPEIKRGKKVLVEKKIMPGYIMLHMNMTDKAWHLVKNVTRVTGFLGGENKPQPVPEREIKSIFEQIESKSHNIASSMVFEVGETIKVIDGPFESFTGSIEEIDVEKERLRVSVSIFGRATPIDLSYQQVEKI